MGYMQAKWYFLMTSFDAETIHNDLRKLNTEFNKRWAVQQRKKYNEDNKEKIRYMKAVQTT